METLGDAVYMVAGGVPDRKENHAQSVAQVALELIEQVQKMRSPHGSKKTLQLRLGKNPVTRRMKLCSYLDISILTGKQS